MVMYIHKKSVFKVVDRISLGVREIPPSLNAIGMVRGEFQRNLLKRTKRFF